MNVSPLRRASGISALPLTVAIEELAGAGRLGQARALVAQRQADLGPYISDHEQSLEMQALQTEFRQHVGDYLDQLMPGAIRAIANLQSFTGLIQTVRRDFQQAPDAGTAQALLDGLLPELDTARDDTRTLADMTARARQLAQPTLDKMTVQVEAYLEQLGDDDGGTLAKLRAEIEAANAQMTAAVQQAVDAGTKIGKQARGLVTWFFSMFNPASIEEKATPKSPKKEEGPDPGDTTAQKKEARLKKPEEPFPAESIGEISTETAKSLDAASALNRSAARLQDLYIRLYRLESTVGIAVYIKQQARDYLKALGALEQAATCAAQAWDSLSAECRAAAAGDGLLFDASWNQSEQRAHQLVLALTGAGASIPRLGRVDNVVPLNQ